MKSNFVIFHPPQREISVDFQVFISGKPLKREICIKYLGIYIDSNLSWKPQIDHISKKIKRSIGILSKLRYYVNISVLTNLYYALIYPFFIYGITAWGNTYPTTLKPVCTLQKKAMHIMTFSRFDEHSGPLFKSLNIIKLSDLVTFHIAIIMFKFHNQLLPPVFNDLLISVNRIHNYNTRHAAKQSYYLPKARTNYEIFNIRFQGPRVWNSIEEQIKSSSLKLFKEKLKNDFPCKY